MSISLGNAAASTGLAAEIADRLVSLGSSWGTFGLLLVTIVATQLLTEVLSNSGAAALMVPIGMATNLMVYGLGGYRFTDFTRLGFPLTVSCALVTAGLLSV
ncbi:SAC1 [Symbiodinium sp. KB8]|nr:SAC1 [Symbiodinium sp. KB8]